MTRLRISPGQHQGRTLAVCAAIIVWLMLIVGEVLPDAFKVTQGFGAYYTASYAVLHGGAAALTDDTAFATWLPRSGVDVREIFAGNIPTLSLLMIPLTAVSPALAETLWLILDVAMLAACAWLAARLCAPHNVTARWWIVAIFALLSPILDTLHLGQVYLLLALLSLVALTALRSQHDIIAGIATAGMLLLKPYYGVLMLGLLLWSRRSRSVLAAIGATLAVIVGSLPLLAEAWPGFPQAEARFADVAWAGIPANQTINSLVRHFFLYTPVWNPEPLANVPWLASVLYFAFLIVLAGLTVLQALRRRNDPFWIWPAALTLMPVLAPVGEVHHLSMLLLPVAVGVMMLAERKTGKFGTGLIIAALFLLIVPWPSLHNAADWGGWRGLFGYPRLIGALLLWAAIVLESGARSSVTVSDSGTTA